MRPTIRSAAVSMMVLGLTLSLAFSASLPAQNATPVADSLLTNQMPDKAVAAGFNAIQLIETNTDLDALRADARFAAFEEKSRSRRPHANTIRIADNGATLATAYGLTFRRAPRPLGQR